MRKIKNFQRVGPGKTRALQCRKQSSGGTKPAAAVGGAAAANRGRKCMSVRGRELMYLGLYCVSVLFPDEFYEY